MTAVLAVLDFDSDGRATGHRLVSPDDPLLDATDLAATRGDGVFEALSFGHGAPQSLDAHLRRLARSARIMDLPEQDPAPWAAAIASVGEHFAELPEAWCRVVLSRGLEGGDRPTGWVRGEPTGDHRRARTEGLRVVVLDRGLRSDAAHTSPWLLAGAKTLSYAVNRAALREAVRRGADDVVFVSSDGLLLEGPTSSLLLLLDGRLVTPRTDLGILEGTSQLAVFDWAAGAGIPTAHVALGVDALHRAEGAWLLSSIRQAAPIRAIDGLERPIDAELTARLNDALLTRTS